MIVQTEAKRGGVYHVLLENYSTSQNYLFSSLCSEKKTKYKKNGKPVVRRESET